MRDAYSRGHDDAVQDAMENAPFASVGGLDRRREAFDGEGTGLAPDYIKEDRDGYLRGYAETAEKMYGPNWMTATFSWAPALVIPANAEKP